MKQFIYLFRGGHLTYTPEELVEFRQQWEDYKNMLGTNSQYNGSDPLVEFTGKQVKAGGIITDGPFTEGKEIVGGYLSMNAHSMEEAVELAKTCPILLNPNGSIEVREVIKM
ncbi:MAG: hypothetical protein COA58_14115 [Bacteroidetes bacterium]|nr:MAG: hypothetical protein COA58_14115 [Bacteroidota bacterium]